MGCNACGQLSTTLVFQSALFLFSNSQIDDQQVRQLYPELCPVYTGFVCVCVCVSVRMMCGSHDL